MKSTATARRLQVRDVKTREILKEYDVTGRPDGRVEKLERALLLRIDTERYFIDDTAVHE